MSVFMNDASTGLQAQDEVTVVIEYVYIYLPIILKNHGAEGY